MSHEAQRTSVLRHHHITLCTGGAQEDYDFHTGVLGLKSVKKTLIYDGQVPLYHLYYGNDVGEESTLVTSFPMGHTGRKARAGSGQLSELSLSIPEASVDYWDARLREHGFEPRRVEAFGEPTLCFRHPCGIEYALAGSTDDGRAPYGAGPVPAEHAIRGTHAYVASVRDAEDMEAFLELGWTARPVAQDGTRIRYEVGAGGPGALVDLVVEPERRTGTWTFGEGAIHHGAFQVESFDVQQGVTETLEGLGFTDCSAVKDRGYFDSVYVRTPGGALFETTVSKPEGFTIDEAPDRLGARIQIAPQFEDRRDEILAQLEPLSF